MIIGFLMVKSLRYHAQISYEYYSFKSKQCEPFKDIEITKVPAKCLDYFK